MFDPALDAALPKQGEFAVSELYAAVAGQIQKVHYYTAPGTEDLTKSENFSYDPWSRLSTAGTGDGTTWGLSWNYDRFGNRLNQNVTAGQAPGPSVTVDPSTNRVTGSTYAYDAAGNMTNDTFNAYTYDAENRITSVNSGLATYVYLGALRVKRNFGGTTVYVYSGTVPIAEYVGASLTKEYIYAGGQLLATFNASTGATTYQFPDHLSTRVEADASGAVTRTFGHFPFGESWYETGTASKWKFTTYERDPESGLDYADFRFYSSRLGRFMSPDLLAGSAMSPESLDRYTYAGNDPVNFFDPSGLGKKGPCMLDSDGNWVGGCGGRCTIDQFSADCGMAYGVVLSGAGYPSFWGGVGDCWQSQWDDNVYCGSGDNIERFDPLLWEPSPDSQVSVVMAHGNPLTPDQQERQCLTNFYNSKLGKIVQFGSLPALLPGWNPSWKENLGEWSVAIFGKLGGLFGSGAITGTTELITLSGTKVVASGLERGLGAALGAVEKVAWPATAVATYVDLVAHALCNPRPPVSKDAPGGG